MDLESNGATVAVKKTFCLVIVLSMLLFGVTSYGFTQEPTEDDIGGVMPTVSVDDTTPPPKPAPEPDFTGLFSDAPLSKAKRRSVRRP